MAISSNRESKSVCLLHQNVDCINCQEYLAERIDKPLRIPTVAQFRFPNGESKKKLSRMASQESCNSILSIRSHILTTDSFNEFLYFINGDDYYKRANELWNTLSNDTKDVFRKRAQCNISSPRNSLLQVNKQSDFKHNSIGKSRYRLSTLSLKRKRPPSLSLMSPIKANNQLAESLVTKIYGPNLTEAQRNKLKEKVSIKLNKILNEISSSNALENTTAISNAYLQEMRHQRDLGNISNKIKNLEIRLTQVERSPNTASPRGGGKFENNDSNKPQSDKVSKQCIIKKLSKKSTMIFQLFKPKRK